MNSAYRDHGHSSGKGKSRDRDHTGDRAEREKAKGPEPLNKMPLNVQEAFVLEDLLFVLMVHDSLSFSASLIPDLLSFSNIGNRGDIYHLSF